MVGAGRAAAPSTVNDNRVTITPSTAEPPDNAATPLEKAGPRRPFPPKLRLNSGAARPALARTAASQDRSEAQDHPALAAEVQHRGSCPK